MRIAIISNITWLTLHFHNFTIYFFFYNFIFDSILLQYFKLSSNLQNKKPFILHQTQKNTQYTVLRNSFTIDTRFSHSHTKYHTSFQTRPVKYEFEFIERELQSARSRCITRSPIVYEYLRARYEYRRPSWNTKSISRHFLTRRVSTFREERKKKKRKKRKREINKYERKDPKI